VLSLESLKLEEEWIGVERKWVELNAGKPSCAKDCDGDFGDYKPEEHDSNTACQFIDVLPGNRSRFRKLPRLIATGYSFAL
jgi:hypothetical protein